MTYIKEGLKLWGTCPNPDPDQCKEHDYHLILKESNDDNEFVVLNFTIHIDTVRIPDYTIHGTIECQTYNINNVDITAYIPNLLHPNIDCQSGMVCIGEEDKDWDSSIVLLMHGLAEILVRPNFADPIVCPVNVSTLEHYYKQFKNSG